MIIKGLSFTGLGCFLNLFQKNIKLISFCSNEYFITFFEIFSLTFLIKNIETHPTLLISMWFILIIYFFIEKKGTLSKFLNNNLFTYLSKYCYSVYISHEHITMDLFRELNIYKLMNIKDDKLIIIIMSFFVGIIFYYLIDLQIKLLKKCKDVISKDKIRNNENEIEKIKFSKIQVI